MLWALIFTTFLAKPFAKSWFLFLLILVGHEMAYSLFLGLISIVLFEKKTLFAQDHISFGASVFT